MLYLRTPFTILLSIMWFMGALPAPADANPLTHFFKKAAHTAIHVAVHVGKNAVVAHYAGHVATALAPASMRRLGH